MFKPKPVVLPENKNISKEEVGAVLIHMWDALRESGSKVPAFDQTLVDTAWTLQHAQALVNATCMHEHGPCRVYKHTCVWLCTPTHAWSWFAREHGHLSHANHGHGAWRPIPEVAGREHVLTVLKPSMILKRAITLKPQTGCWLTV